MTPEIGGTYGLEMQTQDRLHRQFPAGRNLERIQKPGCPGQPLIHQPVGGLPVGIRHRGLLEGGQGGLPTAGRL